MKFITNAAFSLFAIFGANTARAALPFEGQRSNDLVFLASHNTVSLDWSRAIRKIEVFTTKSSGEIFEVSFESPAKCRTRYKIIYGEKKFQNGYVGSVDALEVSVLKSTCKSEALQLNYKCYNRKQEENPDDYETLFTFINGQPTQILLIRQDDKDRLVEEKVLSKNEILSFDEKTGFLKLKAGLTETGVTDLFCLPPMGGGMSIGN